VVESCGLVLVLKKFHGSTFRFLTTCICIYLLMLIELVRKTEHLHDVYCGPCIMLSMYSFVCFTLDEDVPCKSKSYTPNY
jgi:hypothetical protein